MVNAKKEFFKSKFFLILTQVSLPLIAIVVSAYFFYVGQEQRELTITGTQLTNLIETKTEVSNDVIVLYKGDAIHNTVRYFFEIKNTGNRSITQQEVYRFNWIAPNGYQIVEASVINSSNGTSPIDIQIIEPNTLKINITALNKKSTNQISILCISKKQANFNNSYLDVVIADCEVINRIDNYQLPKSEPFWRQVFLGNWGVQIVKSIIYFLIVAIIGVGIFFIIAKVLETIQKRKGMKLITQILSQSGIEKESLQTDNPEWIWTTYKTLSKLSKQELEVFEKLIPHYQRKNISLNEVLSGKILLPNEKLIFEELFHKRKKKIIEITRYSSIFYTKELIEYLRTGKISKGTLDDDGMF